MEGGGGGREADGTEVEERVEEREEEKVERERESEWKDRGGRCGDNNN